MTVRNLIIITLMGCVLTMEAQELNSFLSLDLMDAEFVFFAESFEEQTGIDLYYRDEWIKDIKVTLSGDSIKAMDAIQDVIEAAGLHIGFYNPDRLVIVPVLRSSLDLSFLTESEKKYEHIPKPVQSEREEEKYLDVTRPEQMVQTVTVGKPGNGSAPSVARISGRIRDLDSGRPVIGATMVVTETGKGSISDQHGVVKMSLEPGIYNAQFSFIGMKPFHCLLNVLSDGDFTVQMQTTVIALNEVQIVGNHYRDINSTDVGVERLSMKSVKQIPLFMGENDVIKISRLLPGITSTGEASVGVNVRGGSADQNIFYINRVPVYNTSHMFGFLSAFNSDIIQDFSIYKGNVPVNYGGRLSSVFNIVTRKGNQKNFGLHAGISPVSAHATVEGPIIKDVASFLVSGRSSYSDWMLKRMEDPILRESSASFYDFSGALSIAPDEKNDFSAFYYQSSDQFAYGNMSDYSYGTRGGSLVWKHAYSPALSSTITTAASAYIFENTEKQLISQAYNHSYKLNHNEVIADFSWVPAMNHHLDFGAGLIQYSLDRGIVHPDGDESLRIPVDLGYEKGLEGSIFVSDNITVYPWLSVYAGLRFSFFSNMGPQTVRTYEEDQPKMEGTVTDTLYYGKNKPVTFESGPEIRAAINIKTGQNTSIKFSFSQMRQYLFMLSNTVTISPTDQWKLTDYHLVPPKGSQYTSGIYHIWPRWGVSGSVEIYYKHTDNVVEYRDGASFISSPFTEVSVLQGIQDAFGIEFMLQKSSGRLDGWVNYAYSRSRVQVKGDSEMESINRGDPYPSNFDRPHVLNIIGSYHINRRLTFSSSLVYMSGRPVTYPTSLYYINDYVYIDYYSKNQVRVPDYFRIDASLIIEGNLKAKKSFHSTWSINVFNVLGRNNPQSIFFEPHENYLKGFSFSVIGVPIFTVAWNVKLGNYESN